MRATKNDLPTNRTEGGICKHACTHAQKHANRHADAWMQARATRACVCVGVCGCVSVCAGPIFSATCTADHQRRIRSLAIRVALFSCRALCFALRRAHVVNRAFGHVHDHQFATCSPGGADGASPVRDVARVRSSVPRGRWQVWRAPRSIATCTASERRLSPAVRSAWRARSVALLAGRLRVAASVGKRVLRKRTTHAEALEAYHVVVRCMSCVARRDLIDSMHREAYHDHRPPVAAAIRSPQRRRRPPFGRHLRAAAAAPTCPARPARSSWCRRSRRHSDTPARPRGHAEPYA